MKEAEFRDAANNIMGRRMDFSLSPTLYDEKNRPLLIDLCSAEIKPDNISDEVKAIKLNKNIWINKSILHLLLQHMSINQQEEIYTTGIDIIGLQGYFYKVFQYENIVIALKLDENDIFLPSDEYNLYEFLYCDAMDQIIFLVNHICYLKSNVTK